MRHEHGEEKSAQPRRLNASALLVLLGIIVLSAVANLARPVRVMRHQHQELASLRAEKARLAADNARLADSQGELATDRGLERAARREGYVKPGERRIVFVETESREQTSAPSTK